MNNGDFPSFFVCLPEGTALFATHAESPGVTQSGSRTFRSLRRAMIPVLQAIHTHIIPSGYLT